MAAMTTPAEKPVIVRTYSAGVHFGYLTRRDGKEVNHTSVIKGGDSAKTIDITNILGQTAPKRSPGTFIFKLHGNEYRLEARMPHL